MIFVVTCHTLTATNTSCVITESKCTDGEVEQECRKDAPHSSSLKRQRDADEDDSPRKKLVRYCTIDLCWFCSTEVCFDLIMAGAHNFFIQ